MDNIEGLRRQLVTYSDKLKEAEKEIKVLRKEIEVLRKEKYVYEGEIKVLNQFYQDFKHLVGTDKPTPTKVTHDTVSDETKPNYETLLSEYFVKKDSKILSQLFEDFDKNPVDVLVDILNLNNLENPLPSNIEKIVTKHNLEKEYDIIRKSLILIKNLKRNTFYIEKGVYYLCDSYINSYNKNNKKKALGFLKTALILYPLQFDKFLSNIESYLYDDIHKHIEKFKIELYGKDNILLNDEQPTVNSYDDLPKPKGLDKLLDAKSNRNIEKYRNQSIPELVGIVTNQHVRTQTMKALRIYSYLIRLNEPPEKCLEFYNEVNKQIKYKLK